MNKRKYIMFTMIIIGALSILEWGISFSSIFLIVSMALVYIVFPMKDLCSKNKYLNTLYNIYKVIIIVFVSSFILLEGLILLNISETKDVDKVDNIDTMIVLGAKVNGTEVSNTLKLRLDKAIEYYNKHKSVNIIVSGGQGNYENINEVNWSVEQATGKETTINKNGILTVDGNELSPTIIVKATSAYDDSKVATLTVKITDREYIDPTIPVNLGPTAKILGSTGQSAKGEEPENLFDELDTTKWCTGNSLSKNQWAAFDLGSVKQISQWQVVGGGIEHPLYIPAAYSLQVLRILIHQKVI